MLVRLAAGYGRADSWLDRVVKGLRTATAAGLGHALSVDDKRELGARLYDASPHHKAAGLVAWEAPWLERWLPPAPARLLIGGCGIGREAAVLADRGYVVDGFDPAPGLIVRCRALGVCREVLVGSYEDLIEGNRGPLRSFAAKRYDAVLFGWGSLSHVLAPEDRERAIVAADRLCPEGPLLASFWCSSQPAVAAGRAVAIGSAVGVALARMRGLPPSPASGDVFYPYAGFGHVFTPAEIAGMAAAVGRVVRWGDGSDVYPHATFVRRATAA